MAHIFSPLRYPGGKSCLKPLMSSVLKANKFQRYHYAEPYAGGCGLALSLLYNGHVSEIHINDIDPSIWSFWKSVLYYTDDLIDLINNTEINMKEWEKQKEIQLEEDIKDPLSLGFSAFFLNRTNRSGIIKKAGVIGGKDQKGNYKMDCRFNKEDLIHRIERIKKYKTQINLTRKDAIDFMKGNKNMPEETFFCIDPPYYNKGSCLYTSFYQPWDHQKVSEAILEMKYPWVVTYDNADEIKNLYKKRRQFCFDINYSVQTKRVGTELLIASKGLIIPKDIREKQIHPIKRIAA